MRKAFHANAEPEPASQPTSSSNGSNSSPKRLRYSIRCIDLAHMNRKVEEEDSVRV